MKQITLPAYVVTVGAGALDHLPELVKKAAPGFRIAVVTDSVVASYHGERVAMLLAPHATFTLTAGEQHKTRATWARITDEMLAARLGRDTIVVAVGGGVVGDVAGFVAATYMRGVPVFHVPTTLLAMVDASVGGKTGIDTPAGKNLVGAFHQPAGVLIDTTVLATLPTEQLRAGFAEVVKHGVIADAAYFERSSEFLSRWALSVTGNLDELTSLVARSVEIKAGIVARDEREAGVRKVLNFGHTIGHAIEAATGFGTSHGQAVSIGLVTEARLAEQIGVASAGTARTIERACRAAGLPTSVPAIPADTLISFTRADKKARAGRVEYALPARIGEMAGSGGGWTIPVDDAAVREALSP